MPQGAPLLLGINVFNFRVQLDQSRWPPRTARRRLHPIVPGNFHPPCQLGQAQSRRRFTTPNRKHLVLHLLSQTLFHCGSRLREPAKNHLPRAASHRGITIARIMITDNHPAQNTAVARYLFNTKMNELKDRKS